MGSALRLYRTAPWACANSKASRRWVRRRSPLGDCKVDPSVKTGRGLVGEKDVGGLEVYAEGIAGQGGGKVAHVGRHDDVQRPRGENMSVLDMEPLPSGVAT